MNLHISEPHASYPPEETYLHAFLDDRQHDLANHQPARKLPLIPFCPDALSALRDHRVILTPEFLLPSHRQNPGALPTNCPIRDMIFIPHAHRPAARIPLLLCCAQRGSSDKKAIGDACVRRSGKLLLAAHAECFRAAVVPWS